MKRIAYLGILGAVSVMSSSCIWHLSPALPAGRSEKPPCRDIGDTGSFFNSHLQTGVRTGKGNKYVRSTFPVTQADYGHCF